MDIPTQSSVVASYKSFYCLSYRREHNLYTFHHLYAIHSMKTLFQLILAAFLEFRNPSHGVCLLLELILCLLALGLSLVIK